MDSRQRLLQSDSRQQKALLELAQMTRQLRICQKRLQRLQRLQPIPTETEQSLRRYLEQAATEVYRLGCFVLGVESGK